MQTATRYLERRMVGDLATVTDGRYRRVRVDDKTLDIEVCAPERGDWVDVSALSQGTLDLVYLAARIGLVRLVTGDRRPPLVFDDPFVTLDDERAKRALELLSAITTDFQVIYLTTSDRYDTAADAVVELPGPRGRRRPPSTTPTARAPVETAAAEPPPDRRPDPARPLTGRSSVSAARASRWGAGDFGGGLASRRTPVYGVVLVSQAVGHGVAGRARAPAREPCPEPAGHRLVASSAASLGAIGISALYRGLAVGRMGIVAPVTGVLAALIPVVAGIVLEGCPPPIVLVGIGRRPRRGRPRLARRGRDRRPAGPRAGADRGDGHRPVRCASSARSQRGHVFGPLAIVRAIRRRCSSSRSSWSTRSAWRPAGAAPAGLARHRRPRHGRERVLHRSPSRPAAGDRRRSCRRSTRSRPWCCRGRPARARVTRSTRSASASRSSHRAHRARSATGERLASRRRSTRRASPRPRASEDDDRLESFGRQPPVSDRRRTAARCRSTTAGSTTRSARAGVPARTTSPGRSRTMAVTGSPRRGPGRVPAVGRVAECSSRRRPSAARAATPARARRGGCGTPAASPAGPPRRRDPLAERVGREDLVRRELAGRERRLARAGRADQDDERGVGHLDASHRR